MSDSSLGLLLDERTRINNAVRALTAAMRDLLTLHPRPDNFVDLTLAYNRDLTMLLNQSAENQKALWRAEAAAPGWLMRWERERDLIDA